MSLIHNEQTKLLANALDRASTACRTVGILAPVAAFLWNGGYSNHAVPILAIGVLAWLFAAMILHLSARRVLKGLKP